MKTITLPDELVAALAGHPAPDEQIRELAVFELEARWLILDDPPARRLAASSTLPVIGTAGLLLSAKKAGLSDAVEPKLHRLIHEGFRLSDTVVSAVLKAAGEAPACNPE